MNELLKRQIALLPEHPGVYLMKNKDDVIIYVGKAKNLKKRVGQYFNRPQSGKVAAMVHNVDHFETIAVKTEKEAFILEMNLIKTHYPRYNILMMDDSHYPYIALRRSDGYLSIARRTGDKRYVYFGPYPSSSGAYETIAVANKIFPTRKCATLGKKPCLYYHLGQCLAPCLHPLDKKESEKLFTDLRRFLGGDKKEAMATLKERMEKASEEQRYEDAKEYRKMYLALQSTSEAQSVEGGSSKKDYDCIGYSSREGYFCLSILLYRGGLLLGKESMVYSAFNDGDKEEVAERLAEYYLRREPPKEILTTFPGLPEELSAIMEGIEVYVPKEGVLLSQVELAAYNAREGLDAHFASARLHDDALALLEQLGQLLGIKTPLRIELFDNSHLQGSQAVAAEVCFINGEPAKRLYRKFLLNEENAGDDYHSMVEAVERRYKRLRDEGGEMPDLLLVDGGLPQVHAALEGLKKAEVEIPVYGLFKNDRHQTSGLIDKDKKEYPLSKDSPLFFLLMRMQDEVHRYAISFHRQRREKAMREDVFSGIEGLGPKRQEVLRRHYKSLDALLSASKEELAQFLPLNVAMALYEKLHH